MKPSVFAPTVRLILAASAAVLTAACVSEVAEETSSTTHDLQLGDRGPEVRTVHDYLTRYGYLPNARLSEEFPSWTPAVADAPANPEVFDELLEQGVRAFQTFYRLPQTGIVDEATRSAMAEDRCGVPDDAARIAGEDKWAPSKMDGMWQNTALTYSYSPANRPNIANIDSLVTSNAAEAAYRWSANSGFTFNSTSSSSASIQIVWGDLGSDQPNLLAVSAKTNTTVSGGSYTRSTITLNRNKFWTFAPEPATGRVHFLSVLMHEFGHAIGLGHSKNNFTTGSLPGTTQREAIMAPGPNSGTTRAVIMPDDVQSIRRVAPGHLFMNAPETNTGGGRLVAAFSGSIYATGTTMVGTGYRMFKMGLGNTWTQFTTGAATMIAVSNESGSGGPAEAVWAINNLGEIYRYNNSGSFDRIPGAASAIAAMHSEVWVLGLSVKRNTAEKWIYRWNRTTSQFEQVSGFALDIAVVHTRNSPGGRAEAWFLNEAHEIYRAPIVGDAAPIHETMPGVPGGACGLSSGADGSVFAFACPLGFAGPVYVFNEQPESDEKPALKQWIRVRSTSAWEATADATGAMYHTGNGGMYYTPRRWQF